MAKFNITFTSSRAYQVDDVETMEEAVQVAYGLLEDDLFESVRANDLHNEYEVTDSFEVDEEDAEEEEK